MSPRRPGWYVICEGYTKGPLKTREHAERVLGQIEALGACWYDHRIEEVTR